MGETEQLWAVLVGVAGLLSFVAGSLLVGAPSVDLSTEESIADLTGRRRRVLAGAVASISGAGLLLWPLGFVAASPGPDVWRSLAVFSLAAWVFGFGFLALASLLMVAIVWRTENPPEASLVRTFLDLSHLAIWGVSAPVGALSVATTTAVGLQAGLFGPWVVVAAVLKVLTVLIELSGIGHQRGWNAGGWALGSSGYATVAWFAVVLVALI